jgi:hypothetical protein
MTEQPVYAYLLPPKTTDPAVRAASKYCKTAIHSPDENSILDGIAPVQKNHLHDWI